MPRAFTRRGFLAVTGVKAVGVAAGAAIASGLGGYFTSRLEPWKTILTEQRTTTVVETVTERETVTRTDLSSGTATSVEARTHT